MTSPLASLIASGTKLWLDSVDPELIAANRALGATGATSNPIIISGLVESGRYDRDLDRFLVEKGLEDEEAAWALTDQVVGAAQEVFLPVWQESGGDDGFVSFELDPLLEDVDCSLSVAERAERYIELGTHWSAQHDNRMIKIPATPGGLAAVEELAARGVTLNVTLVFSQRQYREARDAIWRGAQRGGSLERFKSVYSIFISRVDVYTQKHVSDLSGDAQGEVGIVNVKKIWQENQEFWRARATPLKQEIVFASTGTKSADDPPWKYVAALAGSDIQTNPPATNAAVQNSGLQFNRSIDRWPPQSVLEEIEAKVDEAEMERVLMREGLQKFADPQKAFLSLIAKKRSELSDSANIA